MSINYKDPEHDLDNALLDMQASLVQMRQAVINATATHQRTQQQHALALAEIDKWQKRARLALETGKEELATQALAKEKSFIGNVESLKAQLHQQTSTVEMLKRNLIAWESKVAEAKNRRSLLKSRVNAVKTEARPYRRIGGSIANSAATNFEDFDEELIMRPRLQKVEELDKADLEVLLGKIDESCDIDAELAKLGEMLGLTNAKAEQSKLTKAEHDNAYEVLVAVNHLERKLQKIVELSKDASQELADLKIQLQNSRKTQSESTSHDNKIDMELAALKAKLDQL